MNENLSQVEVNIRASWAINCAVALGMFTIEEKKEINKVIYKRAEMFLYVLDEVKALIRPPLKKEIAGRSKGEKKDQKEEVREAGMMAFAEEEQS